MLLLLLTQSRTLVDHRACEHVDEASKYQNGGNPRGIRLAERPQKKNGENRRGEEAHLIGRLGVAQVGELQRDHHQDEELEDDGDRAGDKDVPLGVHNLRGEGRERDPRRVHRDGKADEAALAAQRILQPEARKAVSYFACGLPRTSAIKASLTSSPFAISWRFLMKSMVSAPVIFLVLNAPKPKNASPIMFVASQYL